MDATGKSLLYDDNRQLPRILDDATLVDTVQDAIDALKRSSVPLAAGTINVYIDSVNGLDTNSGVSADSPIQTIGRFYDLYPQARGFMGSTRIQVWLAGPGGFLAPNLAGAPVTYEPPGDTQKWLCWNQGVVFTGPSMVLATLATGTNEPVLTATPTETVDQDNNVAAGGTRTRFNFVAAGWTVNDLRNKNCWLRVSSFIAGAKVQRLFEMPITDNDASAVYVDVASSSGVPIAAGTVFQGDYAEIVWNGAEINTAALNSDLYIGGLGGAGAVFGERHAFSRITFGANIQGLEVANVAGIGFDRCGFKCLTVQIRGGGNTMVLGCKMSVAAGQFDWSTSASNFAYSYQDRVPNPEGGIGAFFLSPPDATKGINCTLTITGGSRLYIGSARGGERGNWVCWYNLCVTGTTAVDAIHIDSQGMLYISATVTGRNNAGYGLNPRYGGQVVLAAGGQRATIYGATASIRVGKDAGINWGTGAGQFEDAATWNGNFHRTNYDAAGPTTTGDMSRIAIAIP